MQIKFFIFLLGLFVMINGQPEATQIDTSLRQIIVMFRNGPRAPTKSYPTDPYGPTFWSRYGGLGLTEFYVYLSISNIKTKSTPINLKLGQITPKGLFQAYSLGQFLKNYYSRFLNPTYDPERVFSRSIDTDRSLMSSSTFLSGMYPPANGDQLWSPSVTWYPIPVHTNEPKLDKVFVNDCPKYTKMLNAFMNTPDYLTFQQKNMQLLQNISNFTGSNITNYLDLSFIAENARCKLASNLPLEQWLQDSLQNLTNANQLILNLKYGNVENAKLISGSLMYDAIVNIRKKAAGSKNEIYIYSVEDSHLNAIQTLLNISPPLSQLNFGAALILELRQDANSLYYLQIRLRNDSLSEPISLNSLKMENCDELCPLGNFLSLVLDKVVPDLQEACGVNSNDNSSMSTFAPYTPTTNPFSINTQSSYPFTSNPLCPPINTDTKRKEGLSVLELGLIIGISLMGAFSLLLITFIGLLCYRNKVVKTNF